MKQVHKVIISATSGVWADSLLVRHLIKSQVQQLYSAAWFLIIQNEPF